MKIFKRFKKVCIMFAVILSVSLLAGCGITNAAGDGVGTENAGAGSNDADASGLTADTTIETIYTASEENVKMLGRTYFEDGKLLCALSGSGIEFSFSGTKCVVTIIGDSGSLQLGQADNHARFAVYINGERVLDEMINKYMTDYTVFESETPQDVTVSIVKLSESSSSTFSIGDIKVTGTTIKPTAEKDLLIEFIGDSITCGYGVDDPDENNHFSTRTEDVTKTYAYLTAQALDADYSMVSYSGHGIISGFTTGDKVTSQLVPPYYTKLGYSRTPNPHFDPLELEWDFDKRQPDVIVINLGTNDDSYTGSDAARQEEFRAEYVEFLKTIRENNPDAKILCTLGIMGDRLFPVIEQAVADYTAETSDTNVYTMKFDVQSAADGYGADWHPSPVTHEKAAEKLVAEIEALLAQ